MTDLSSLVPDFSSEPYSHLLPTLEHHSFAVADILSLDARTIAARTRLPILDIARLAREIAAALREQIGISSFCCEVANDTGRNSIHGEDNEKRGEILQSSRTGKMCRSGFEMSAIGWPTISTLDPQLDSLLGGGIPMKYLTEVVGESGAGKTQLLLTLLLASQLPVPQGAGRPVVYISTEHALPTQRLMQLLATNPVLTSHADLDGLAPSLSRILTIHASDIETQEHVLTYQLPVVMATHRPGLIVLDSIAANYRDAPGGASGLAARAASLHRTGILLRQLAHDHDCAVVVSNHVADRFYTSGSTNIDRQLLPSSGTPHGEARTLPQSSPNSSALQNADVPDSSRAEPPPSSQILPLRGLGLEPQPTLTLDHQQRFFTGWGDDPTLPADAAAKTPALGLVWANQIAARIAIVKEAAWGEEVEAQQDVNVGSQRHPVAKLGSGGHITDLMGREERDEWTPSRWRRWMRLVFAAWTGSTPAGDRGLEVEIWAGGIRAKKDQHPGSLKDTLV